jgi:Cu/Ag efflux pump CusA
VQITGRNVQASRVYAQKLLARMKLIPGLADARIQQPANAPQLNVDVSRARIGQYGLTERDVTNSLAASLAGTSQTAPVFFVIPKTACNTRSWRRRRNTCWIRQRPFERASLRRGRQRDPATRGLAGVSRGNTVPVISHYNIQPALDIYGTTEGRDLGAVSGDIQAAIKALERSSPRA